jgi:hypothetical protein
MRYIGRIIQAALGMKSRGDLTQAVFITCNQQNPGTFGDKVLGAGFADVASPPRYDHSFVLQYTHWYPYWFG